MNLHRKKLLSDTSRFLLALFIHLYEIIDEYRCGFVKKANEHSSAALGVNGAINIETIAFAYSNTQSQSAQKPPLASYRHDTFLLFCESSFASKARLIDNFLRAALIFFLLLLISFLFLPMLAHGSEKL